MNSRVKISVQYFNGYRVSPIEYSNVIDNIGIGAPISDWLDAKVQLTVITT